MDFTLTAEEKKILLAVARERIKADLGLGSSAAPDPTAKLREICGAFVTLHSEGLLRGCIGNIVGRKPLIDTISSMAHAAAFDDPRFPSLSQGEFDRIEIEISVLSPLWKIGDINEIEIGKHGIFMTRGFNSGVLLPQVATEQRWGLTQFVEHTCMKAGLSPDAWKMPDTVIEIFSAVVFSEKEIIGS